MYNQIDDSLLQIFMLQTSIPKHFEGKVFHFFLKVFQNSGMLKIAYIESSPQNGLPVDGFFECKVATV